MAGIASASMILQLFLLFGQQATTADQVLDRYANARKQPLKFEATIQAGFGEGTSHKTHLITDGTRAVFKVFLPQGNYTALISPKLVREIDAASKMVDEHGFFGMNLEGSRLSGAAGLFPVYLQVEDLRKLVSGGKWELKGREVLHGIGSDRIHVRQEEQGRGADVTVHVDDRGYIVGLDDQRWTPMGKTRRKWVVTDYRIRTTIQPSELDLPYPIGYSPYAVDAAGLGLGIGEPFPLAGWSTAHGGSAKLHTSKPSLVVIYGEECEPSKRALPWLKRLSARLPVSFISDSRQPVLVPEALVDSSGELLEKISYQATPLMFLISPQGKILGMWMGYDLAKSSVVEKEIIDTAAGPEY